MRQTQDNPGQPRSYETLSQSQLGKICLFLLKKLKKLNIVTKLKFCSLETATLESSEAAREFTQFRVKMGEIKMHYVDQRLLGKHYLPYNVDFRRDHLPYHIKPKFKTNSKGINVFTGYEILNRKYNPIFNSNTQNGIFMRIDTKLATLLNWDNQNSPKFETHKYYDHKDKLKSKKIMMGLHLYDGNGPDDAYWSRLKILSTLY